MAAPVLAVARVPERAILLFADFQDLCAYGPNGIIWWIKRLALDALKVESITAGVISGSGNDSNGQQLHFQVDPATGRYQGGWTNATLMRPRDISTDGAHRPRSW
jgi:hypothetical protein